jgi:hypothetical protein
VAFLWDPTTICLVWKGESSLTTYTFFVFVLLLIVIVMIVFALLLVCLFAIPEELVQWFSGQEHGEGLQAFPFSAVLGILSGSQ